MLFLPKTAATHEELFAERYDRLFSWALQLTDRDYSAAEDLLHDAFILFTLNQPELGSIRNLDAYLHTVLRNLHISQMRSPTRSRFQQLSILDYDSAEIGLWSVDPRDQIHAQDQLRRVCHYACARKDTAKTASVLILRFFHGYYPSEIVRILRTTRNSTDRAMLLSRGEAKASLEDPGSLAFIGKNEVPQVLRADFARTAEGFLGELREIIFCSRKGECLSRDQLKRLYHSRKPASLSCEHLSHVVSCPRCLDEVNRLLGLPLLSERYPTDTINKDTSPKGGPKGGAPSGGSPRGLLRKWKRQARATFEHKPQELCIAVNGYIQGSQRISSDLMQQSFIIDTPDKIGFVEVFSEQGFRLLLLNIDEPPPVGPGEHSIKVGLSDQRALELSLRFTNPWPTVHVTYSDPLLKDERVGQFVSDEAFETPAEVESPRPKVQSPVLDSKGLSQRVRSWLGIGHWTLDIGLFLRPSAVTAILALLVLAVALFTFLTSGPVSLSARDLLARSAATEETLAARTDQVIHRTITLEERKSEPGAVATVLIARRKIEVWQSAEKGITARRLYDEKNQLLAGDWRRADGVQTLYHHGTQPKLQLAPEKRRVAAVNFDSAWQLSPSAKEFSSIIGPGSSLHVEERGNVYVVSAESAKSVDSSSVTSVVDKAVLVLNRSDLHPIEQTLVIRQGSETREYKFIETTFEQKVPSSVTPSVFEPEPELLSSAKTDTRPRTSDTLVSQPLPAVASAELEVEVLQRLNQAGALLGEQVSLTRTREGLLRVEGVVEADQRKREILNALGSAANNPAVRVDLQTVSEAVARQKRSSSGAVTVQQLESSKSTITVDSELRKYLSSSRGLSGDQLDQEVRAFSDRVISRSRQARRHALALKQITERFSGEELRTLDPAARIQWRSLVSEHARAFQQAMVALRRELQPVFAAGGVSEEREMEISAEADFARAARRLFDLAAANDDAVRTAFSISDENASAVRIKSPQFWRSLAAAEALAAKINSAADTRR